VAVKIYLDMYYLYRHVFLSVSKVINLLHYMRTEIVTKIIKINTYEETLCKDVMTFFRFNPKIFFINVIP